MTAIPGKVRGVFPKISQRFRIFWADISLRTSWTSMALPKPTKTNFCEDAAHEEIKQTLQEWLCLYALPQSRPSRMTVGVAKMGAEWQIDCLGELFRVGRNSGQARREISLGR